MSDRDDDDSDAFVEVHGTPTGRVYMHTRCGGQTQVSGGDYTHICDPFWPCTSTYCCQCAGFAPLSEVSWVDTGERISDYRRRMRMATPGVLQAWRAGVGFLIGGAVGAGIGLLVVLVAQVPRQQFGTFALIGGAVGAAICYFLGTVILNRVLGIDYRRMR